MLGRRREQEGLVETLGQARMVTVTGAGGIGKTTLVRATLPEAPVCVLRAARSTAQVAAVVAQQLGVDLCGAGDDAAALAQLARGAGSATLVLDEAEECLDATREVCDALLAGSEARLVVTSRVALGLEDEREIRLAGLPPADALALLEARSGPIPLEERAPAAALVQALDGLPLAIELAAGRLAWLDPAALLAQLEDPRWLARPGDEGRQGTLQRALAWSVDHLEPPIRRVLVQLSWFEGSFEARDAHQVVRVPGVFVPDALAELHRAGLLSVRGSSLSLLSTVRRLARWSLASEEPGWSRHADWAVRGPWRLELCGSDLVEQKRQLRRRVPDLWAVLEGDGEHAAAAALRLEAWAQDNISTARHLEILERGLSAVADPGLRARLLWCRALVRRRMAALGAAMDDAEQAEALAVQADDLSLAARARLTQGVLAGVGGDWVAARAHLAAARDRARTHGLAGPWGHAELALARPLLEAGDLVGALDGVDLAIRLLDEASDQIMAARARIERSAIALELGRASEAIADLERATAAFEELEDVVGASSARLQLATSLAHVGRYDEASPLLRVVIAEARRRGATEIEFYAVASAMVVAGLQGDDERSAALERQARATAARAGWTVQLHMLDTSRGIQALLRGQLAEAVEILAEVEARPEAPPPVVGQARIWRLAGAALAGSSDAAVALDNLGTDGLMTHDRRALQVLRGAAEVCRGDREAAARRVAEAPDGVGPAAAVRLVQAALDRSEASVLAVRTDGSGAVLPGGSAVDLTRHPLLGRILCRLAEARCSDPGVPLETEAVLAAGWPGDRILPDAAKNRVYVAINRLRRAGLGDLLQTRDGGYLLDPSVPLRLR